MGKQIIIDESEYKQLKRKAKSSLEIEEELVFFKILAGMLLYVANRHHEDTSSIHKYAEKQGYTKLTVTTTPQRTDDFSQFSIRYIKTKT